MMKKKLVNLRVIIVFYILLFVLLTLCGCADNVADGIETSNVEFPMSGHVLYGYKHGITIYGQYMDQAGEDNAMILILVEKEEGILSKVICKSVAINDVQVSSIIKTENVTPTVTAIEIQVSSSETDIDDLQSESHATVSFEIIDLVNGTIIDKTHPVSFPCN